MAEWRLRVHHWFVRDLVVSGVPQKLPGRLSDGDTVFQDAVLVGFDIGAALLDGLHRSPMDLAEAVYSSGAVPWDSHVFRRGRMSSVSRRIASVGGCVFACSC